MPHVRGVLALASLLVLSAPAALRAQAGDAAPGEGERAAAVDAAMASAATRLLARDYAGAETVTREALGLDASRPALHCALGDALAGQGSRDAAFEAYASCRERAQALAQVVAEGRALMGRARLALRQPDDARAADALAALLRFAEAHPGVLAPRDAQALERAHAARLSREAAYADLRRRRARGDDASPEE